MPVRVFNLDESGVKLMTKGRDAMYLSPTELNRFVKGEYSITNQTLHFQNKSVQLNGEELTALPHTVGYLKKNFTL